DSEIEALTTYQVVLDDVEADISAAESELVGARAEEGHLVEELARIRAASERVLELLEASESAGDAVAEARRTHLEAKNRAERDLSRINERLARTEREIDPTGIGEKTIARKFATRRAALDRRRQDLAVLVAEGPAIAAAGRDLVKTREEYQALG